MATVRKALSELRTKLELHKYYEWLTETEEAQRGPEGNGRPQSEEGGDLGKQAERLINSLLASADDDIANKIRQIVEQISTKVCSQLLRHHRVLQSNLFSFTEVVSRHQTVLGEDDGCTTISHHGGGMCVCVCIRAVITNILPSGTLFISRFSDFKPPNAGRLPTL